MTDTSTRTKDNPGLPGRPPGARAGKDGLTSRQRAVIDFTYRSCGFPMIRQGD
ncbi:hypothetical protein ACFC6U_38490 [Kitasatospora purpeofusca]|uniref:hypothetical protein n=1 Tax=Kitasatospora purpeofusca TaxID=67352 RepID=UPI0035DA14CA